MLSDGSGSDGSGNSGSGGPCHRCHSPKMEQDEGAAPYCESGAYFMTDAC
jgi:hypothetical protein